MSIIEDRKDLAEILEIKGRKVSFGKNSKILYKNHIPISCFFAVDAKIKLKKKNFEKNLELKNALMCFDEFLGKKKSIYDVEVMAGSSLIYIDRETLIQHVLRY
jgi:hypothetical protein